MRSATFAFDDESFDPVDDRNLNRSANEFYLSGATIAAVPLPATLPLLAGALGLLGFGAKRRRKQAA